MVGKAKSKVNQAQAAQSGAPAAQAQPVATRTAAPAPPAGAGGMTVISSDPNHVSAIKALEQIKRDEENSSEGNTFTYDPGDRRDPFLSPQDILAAQMSGQVCKGEGMECWLIQDVTIIGVLTRKNGNVALVIGPDGYGTTLHEGDKLYDGEVRRIDPVSGLVVFRQKISDPTRIKPFRDVEKGLNLNKEGRS
jgi:Tfp pilus assembly protein PilP